MKIEKHYAPTDEYDENDLTLNPRIDVFDTWDMLDDEINCRGLIQVEA